MMRPSHWILISFVAFASVVTATGSWRRALSGPRVDHWVEQREAHAQRAVELGQPVELFGAVLDRQGWPVEGATVKTREGDAVSTTDADGRFALVVQGRRSQALSIEAEGHQPITDHVGVPGKPAFVVLGDATPWTDEVAAAQPSLLFGEGFLVERDGSPVPFGTVAVRETGATVASDEHGRFQIPLPVAESVVLIARDREGRVARSKPFRPSNRQGRMPVADLVVDDGLMIDGFVRDDRGQVCDGAVVVATDGEVEHFAITGRSGIFQLPGLCADTEYTLCVLPHRGMLGDSRKVTLTSDLETDLFIHQAVDRRFRVVTEDDTPSAEAHVAARWSLSLAHGVTDADGWVTLPGVAAFGRRAAVTFDVRDAALQPLEVIRVEGDVITVRG